MCQTFFFQIFKMIMFFFCFQNLKNDKNVLLSHSHSHSSLSSFVMIKVETIHSLFFLLILSFDPTLRLEQKNLNKINPSCKTFQRQFHHLRKVRKVEQDLVARGSTKSLFNKVRVNRTLCVLSCALLLLFSGPK